jgi:hypothetical protein
VRDAVSLQHLHEETRSGHFFRHVLLLAFNSKKYLDLSPRRGLILHSR